MLIYFVKIIELSIRRGMSQGVSLTVLPSVRAKSRETVVVLNGRARLRRVTRMKALN